MDSLIFLLQPDTIAAFLSWIICIAITIVCVSHIEHVYRAENRARQPALTAALIIAAIVTVTILKIDISLAVTEYLQSTNILAVSATISLLTGWLVLLTGRIKKYGPFFEVYIYAMVIGLSLYARVAAPSQIELCVASFIVGAFIRIVQDAVSRPDLPETRADDQSERAAPITPNTGTYPPKSARGKS